jgi:hypothetical protein
MKTKRRSLWSKQKPGYHEKTLMLNRCGKRCFLGSKTSFPICKKKTCKISKNGIQAAYVRSRQYRKKGSKYYAISRKARMMLDKK